MEPKDRLEYPEERRDIIENYKHTKNYPKMDKRLQEIYDYMEENGMYGGKRYANADVKKWKENRDSMTPEELAKWEDESERKGAEAGKGLIIGIVVIFALAIIGCIVAVQHPELTDLAHWNH